MVGRAVVMDKAVGRLAAGACVMDLVAGDSAAADTARGPPHPMRR